MKLKIKKVYLPTKFKINSSFFKQISILKFIDLILSSALIFLTPISLITSNGVNLWLSLLFLVFISKLIRSFYHGSKIFPTVSYDIPMLFGLTLLMITSLIQGNNTQNLGIKSGVFFSPAILAMFGLSVYFLHLYFKEHGFSKKLFKFLAILLNIFGILYSFTPITWVIILILNLWILGGSSSNLFKYILIALPILGVILNIVSTQKLGIETFIILIIGFAFLLIFSILYKFSLKQIRLNFPTLKINNIYFDLKKISIFLLLTFVILLISTNSITYIDGIISFAKEIQTNLFRFIVGEKITYSNVGYITIIRSYGLLGILSIVLFFSGLIKLIHSSIKTNLEDGEIKELHQFAINFAIVLITITLAISVLQPVIFFILAIGFAFIAYSTDSKSTINVESVDNRKFILNKILKRYLPSKILAEILNGIRILLIVVIIILTPTILQQISIL